LIEDPKLYIDENGKGFFKCPHCGKQVSIDIIEFQGLTDGVKVKCACGGEFKVCLGLRTGRRKQGFFRGNYVKLPQGKEKGRIRVRDVSTGGAHFTTWNAHNLKVGDEILLQFVLEDHKGSEIERTAAVRWVKDMAIGCQFTDRRKLDPDLGFYVMDLSQQNGTIPHRASGQPERPTGES
jgi:hypothetical protein